MSGSAKSDLPFSCTCGAMQGHVTARGARSGTHVVCYCQDCRAAQLYFGQPDPAPGPVDILQTASEDIIITHGRENLAAIQLSPNGMFRWYAACCNAPLVNTPKTPAIPFGGFMVARLADTAPLGPITTRGFVPNPNGKPKHEKMRYMVFGLIRRALVSRITGRWKTSAFFDPDSGGPTVAPKVLTKEERLCLYD